jgi:hypothetical protein
MTNKNVENKNADAADNNAEKSAPNQQGYTSKETAYAAHKTKQDKRSGLASPMLITVLLALPVAAVIAYVYMPEELNKYLSFDNSLETTASKDAANSTNRTDYIPATASMDSPVATRPGDYAIHQHQPQYNQQPDWMERQRAEFEKRRSEYQQYNANRLNNQSPPATSVGSPQWVIDRQAEIEKQRVEMEKQREQYLKQVQEQQARWVNNQASQQAQYHSGINPYQQHAGANRQPAQPMPYAQYQRYNPYRPAQGYPPAPIYYYAPNNAAYGYPGYR